MHYSDYKILSNWSLFSQLKLPLWGAVHVQSNPYARVISCLLLATRRQTALRIIAPLRVKMQLAISQLNQEKKNIYYGSPK